MLLHKAEHQVQGSHPIMAARAPLDVLPLRLTCDSQEMIRVVEGGLVQEWGNVSASCLRNIRFTHLEA